MPAVVIVGAQWGDEGKGKATDLLGERVDYVVKFNGGPVGLNNLAVAVGEESDTLEEVYEPYLIQEGYLERTSKGRVATPLACERLQLELPRKRSAPQGELPLK